MKRLLCVLLCLCLCSCCLAEETAEGTDHLIVDDAMGIGYLLSERWHGVEISEADAAAGICAMYTAEDGSLLAISLAGALDEDGQPLTEPEALAELYRSAGLEPELLENGAVLIALPEQDALIATILNGQGMAVSFAFMPAGEEKVAEAADTTIRSITLLPEEETTEPATTEDIPEGGA